MVRNIQYMESSSYPRDVESLYLFRAYGMTESRNSFSRRLLVASFSVRNTSRRSAQDLLISESNKFQKVRREPGNIVVSTCMASSLLSFLDQIRLTMEENFRIGTVLPRLETFVFILVSYVFGYFPHILFLFSCFALYDLLHIIWVCLWWYAFS